MFSVSKIDSLDGAGMMFSLGLVMVIFFHPGWPVNIVRMILVIGMGRVACRPVLLFCPGLGVVCAC